VLSGLALFGQNADARPEVHLFLADRYWTLAAHYQRTGKLAKAHRLDAKAWWHYTHGGGDDLRPAAAAALRRPSDSPVNAVGTPRLPDDAA
jgi:hypothetical protein